MSGKSRRRVEVVEVVDIKVGDIRDLGGRRGVGVGTTCGCMPRTLHILRVRTQTGIYRHDARQQPQSWVKRPPAYLDQGEQEPHTIERGLSLVDVPSMQNQLLAQHATPWLNLRSMYLDSARYAQFVCPIVISCVWSTTPCTCRNG
jgi:hypothetical protein